TLGYQEAVTLALDPLVLARNLGAQILIIRLAQQQLVDLPALFLKLLRWLGATPAVYGERLEHQAPRLCPGDSDGWDGFFRHAKPLARLAKEVPAAHWLQCPEVTHTVVPEVELEDVAANEVGVDALLKAEDQRNLAALAGAAGMGLHEPCSPLAQRDR